eukprot:810750-Amphidinium_carterae.1
MCLCVVVSKPARGNQKKIRVLRDRHNRSWSVCVNEYTSAADPQTPDIQDVDLDRLEEDLARIAAEPEGPPVPLNYLTKDQEDFVDGGQRVHILEEGAASDTAQRPRHQPREHHQGPKEPGQCALPPID